MPDIDDNEDELEVCPDCGYIICICDTEPNVDDDLEDRYLDKRLSDRDACDSEDFHSDEARFDSFDEPYIPEF